MEAKERYFVYFLLETFEFFAFNTKLPEMTAKKLPLAAADPGFLQGGGGANSPGGGANIRFCQIFPKTA